MKLKTVLLSAVVALPVIAGAAFAVGGGMAAQNAAKLSDDKAVVAPVSVSAQSAAVTDRDAALIDAAERGDVATVDRLLKEGADKNAVNGFGASALYAAASHPNPAATERLLAAGADPNAHLLSGETPLMEASYRGNSAVAQTLLKAHANANVQETNGGQTALMWAIQQQHPEIAAALIQAGVKVDVPSKQGMTALMLAAQEDDAHSAGLLLKAGANPNLVAPKQGWTALIMASAMGNTEAAHVLLANKADPNVVDATGFTALIYAAHEKTAIALVKDLLEHGANPNVRIAKDAPNLETRNGIILFGATPLAIAAYTNNYDIVEALLAHKADPEIATNLGTTPLMLASECAFEQNQRRPADEKATAIKTVKLLVEHGAKVNRVGQFKLAAIHCAAIHGMNDVIAFLASKGADVNLKDDIGETPLSIANAIITKGAMAPGVNHRRIARDLMKDTAALLQKLGATPIDKAGIEIASQSSEG